MTQRGGPVVVVAVALAAAATVYVVSSAQGGDRVARPPAAAAAAARTATITSGVIEQQYVFSGELTAAAQARPLSSQGVVTATPLRSGREPKAGTAILEVNGRPVIALDLPFPLWRELSPDVEGKDVSAVQRALRSLKRYDGSINGRFDASTRTAIEKLYADLGYPAPGGGDRISLPEGEVAAIGGGPWRLDLAGAVLGTELGGGDSPTLTGSGSRLTLDDEGRLAGLVTPEDSRQMSIVGETSQPTPVTVVSDLKDGDSSVIVVRPRSGSLDAGTVTGSVVVKRSDGEVTSVPVTALRPGPDGRTTVRLQTADRTTDVPVTVGLRGDRLVEVSGPGVVPGATVQLP